LGREIGKEVDANGQPLPQEESRFEQPLPRAILHCSHSDQPKTGFVGNEETDLARQGTSLSRDRRMATWYANRAWEKYHRGILSGTRPNGGGDNNKNGGHMWEYGTEVDLSTVGSSGVYHGPTAEGSGIAHNTVADEPSITQVGDSVGLNDTLNNYIEGPLGLTQRKFWCKHAGIQEDPLPLRTHPAMRFRRPVWKVHVRLRDRTNDKTLYDAWFGKRHPLTTIKEFDKPYKGSLTRMRKLCPQKGEGSRIELHVWAYDPLPNMREKNWLDEVVQYNAHLISPEEVGTEQPEPLTLTNDLEELPMAGPSLATASAPAPEAVAGGMSLLQEKSRTGERQTDRRQQPPLSQRQKRSAVGEAFLFQAARRCVA